MKRIVACAAAALLFSGCGSFAAPKDIAFGKWNYKLLINGVEAGTAEISSARENDRYVSSSEFRMDLAGVATISRESVTETLDFTPVGFESYSKITSGGDLHETIIKAAFDGSRVDLSINGKKSSYVIKKQFILEGNSTIVKLIAGRFREGMEIESYIYNPGIELEEPVLIKTRVAGIEDMEINGKRERLIHITQLIENIKSIDIYLDSGGVAVKAEIRMLNMKLELIKI